MYVYVALTSACCVHSNVQILNDTCCIRYLTTVDSIHSTSPAEHTYHTRASRSVEVPLVTTASNPSSIWEEPVPYGATSMRRSATSRLICQAEQGILIITNVFQGYKTVVLVCCTSEWEPDTLTCNSGREGMQQPMIYIQAQFRNNTLKKDNSL